MNYSAERSFENQSALPTSKHVCGWLCFVITFHLINKIYHEIRGKVKFFQTDRIISTLIFFHKPQYVELVQINVNILFETRVRRKAFRSIFTTTFSVIQWFYCQTVISSSRLSPPTGYSGPGDVSLGLEGFQVSSSGSSSLTRLGTLGVQNPPGRFPDALIANLQKLLV